MEKGNGNMAKNSLWNKDVLSKIDSYPEYMKELFIIKDALISLKDKERKKEKEYYGAKAKRKFQQDKLERAYEGLEKFRK